MTYPKYNNEGYPDPTPHQALKHCDTTQPSKEEDERFHRLLGTLFYICDIAGFRIRNRMIIEDRETGRIWE